MATATAAQTLSFWDALVPLLPVVIGGLIGIVGGVGGTTWAHHLRAKEERKMLRRSKLEHLVAQLQELEHWAGKIRYHFLYDEGERLFESNPAAKSATLAAIHFPTLSQLAGALEIAADKYELALMQTRQKMLEAGAAAAEETARSMQAANPAASNIAEHMKVAAQKARLEVGKDTEAINEAYQAVVIARSALSSAARDIAGTL